MNRFGSGKLATKNFMTRSGLARISEISNGHIFVKKRVREFFELQEDQYACVLFINTLKQ